MPSFSDILGPGTVAEQLLVWGLLNQLLGDFLGPFLEVVRQDVNAKNPVAVETPPILADQVVRGILDQSSAATEAAKSGMDADRFGRQVQGAGEPPGLEFVLEALRRGYVDVGQVTDTGPSLMNALAKSRVYTYWSGVVQQMASRPISVGDSVDAYIRGQIPESQAQAEAWANGIDSDRFTILANTAGRPPALGELIELVRRNIIPQTGTGPDALTFEQGIYEGDNKDKWLPAYVALQTYIPPPRTITTLLSHGAITTAQANQLFQANGLTPDMAAAYVTSATSTKLASAKALAVGNVEKLYTARLIDRPTAIGLLDQLGYTQAEQNYLLELWDFAVAERAYSSAVSRVGTLYISRKIVRASAVSALQALDVPPEAMTALLGDWDNERAATVKDLTAGEIVDAVYYQLKPESWALQQLEALGYTPDDAWTKLGVRLHGTPQTAEPGGGQTPGNASPTV